MAEAHMYVPNVEAVVLRHVPGEGDQVELCIKAADGELVVRCLSRRGRGIRVMNLRPRDKRRAALQLQLSAWPQQDEVDA
jgi:hypothetical protein